MLGVCLPCPLPLPSSLPPSLPPSLLQRETVVKLLEVVRSASLEQSLQNSAFEQLALIMQGGCVGGLWGCVGGCGGWGHECVMS